VQAVSDWCSVPRTTGKKVPHGEESMEFEKDQFEDDEELSRLEDDEELGGEPGAIVEEEEELLIVEEEPGDEGDEPAAKPAAKPAPKPSTKKAAPKKAAKKKAKKPAKKAKKKPAKKAPVDWFRKFLLKAPRKNRGAFFCAACRNGEVEHDGRGGEDRNGEGRVPEGETRARDLAGNLPGESSIATIIAHDQGSGRDPADARRRPVAPDEVLGRKLLRGEVSK
jgi:hypothetical protein